MSLLVLFAFALDLRDARVSELQYLYFAHLTFYPGPPYELVDGHQCFILAPAVFLQGHGEHFDGLPRHVLVFFALDVLVSHLHAVFLFGSSSSLSLLETQHELMKHAST